MFRVVRTKTSTIDIETQIYSVGQNNNKDEHKNECCN